MKWSVVMLLGLGLVAALCAAILVAGLSGSGASAKPSNQSMDSTPVKVMVASHDLDPLTIVDATCIQEENSTRSALRPNSLTSTVEVVGRVLSIGMKKGQPFTSNVFAAEGSGTKVAPMIPKGKRAIGISIQNHSALDGILYPGASVDVNGTFRAVGSQGSTEFREPMTITLLEGVEVLAIERNTVVSQEVGGGKDEDGTARGGGARRVTLLVTPQQGKILQLAMEQGVLSLALRNPTDMEAASHEGVTLQQLLNPDETPTRRAFEEALSQMRSKDPFASTMPTASAAANMAARRNMWETTIMRGPAIETVHFSMPEESGSGNGGSGASNNKTEQ